ncbi:MAG: hypothetical protein HHAS10_06350 [Candidatus Altimarinota bacterium]
MGLFDNLFLDQNTPVTINDGMDHSKDVVTELIDPNASTGTHTGDPSAGGNPQDDTKKDDSISDLFASDKKEETEAHVALNPDSPTDVALEIGDHPMGEISPLNSIAPADPNMLASSFDIGGDLSFDNIAESTLLEGETDSSSNTAEPQSGITVLDASSVAQAESPNPTDSPVSGAVPNGGILDLGASAPLGASQEGSESLPVKNEEAPNQAPITPNESILPSAPAEGGILDLIGGGSPEAPVASVPEPVAPTTNAPIDFGAPVPQDSVQVPVSPIQSPIQVGAPEVIAPVIPTQVGTPSLAFAPQVTLPEMPLLGRDALALLREGAQTSTLLREKLYSFIEELKTLHSRDQSQRYHKLEQIAMYEERIREIDAEAANRKRVLQSEIDDLKRQIEIMDREKNDIQEVISTFQKEVSHG